MALTSTGDTMRSTQSCIPRLLATATLVAWAWAPPDGWARSASGYRGSATWGGGSGSATGRYGGSASWQAGSGGSATTARGGTASFGGGSGSAQGAYGGSAAWSHGSGTATGRNGNTATWNDHAAAYGYHPPVRYPAPYPAATRYPVPVHAAPVYYGNPYNATTGEVAAAGMAGMAVGAMAGSAAAKQQQSATATQTAAAPPPTSINSPLPMGTRLSNLPAGCTNAVVKSVEYYVCGPNWFKPVFGGSGVFYQVVPAPF